jgi:flagellar biosynthesis protein
MNRSKGHKLKKAVGINYDKAKDRAPKVIAKGSGHIAQKIIDIAKEHGIPLYEDPDLVEILSEVDFFKEIHPDTYQIIAEILAFIYMMNNKLKEQRGGLIG